MFAHLPKVSPVRVSTEKRKSPDNTPLARPPVLNFSQIDSSQNMKMRSRKSSRYDD